MKPIVAATDFSSTSDNAVRYAAFIANQSKASLVLVNVYQIPITTGDIPPVMVPVEDLKAASESGLERVQSELKEHFPDVDFVLESRLGDVTTEMSAYAEVNPPALVVIGNHHATGLDWLLSGDSKLDLIRQLKVPVIAVPDAYSSPQLRHIAMAVDEHFSSESIQLAKQFAADLQASLQVIHVQTDEHEQASRADYSSIENLQVIHNKNLVEGLESFIRQLQIDLLIVLPHEHSKFSRLFSKSNTEGILNHIKVPVMSILQG